MNGVRACKRYMLYDIYYITYPFMHVFLYKASLEWGKRINNILGIGHQE